MFSVKYLVFYSALVNTLLVLALIYLFQQQLPVPTRNGCILYSRIEYCALPAYSLCSTSTLNCFLAYTSQIFSNVFWLIFGFGLSFSIIKTVVWANASYYRDLSITRDLAIASGHPVRVAESV